MADDFSNTALTGIEAASYDLSIISNDIANSNTIGYKSAKATFHDIYSGSGENESGMGVGIGETLRTFDEGSAVNTGIDTNMRISGKGFFILSDSVGQKLYSRAGDFSLDKDGYFVSREGHKLQGYPGTNTSGITGDIRIDKMPAEPVATQNAEILGNLSSKDNKDFTQTITAYDTRGDSHTIETNYAYNSTTTNWDVTCTVDGVAPTPAATQSLSFDASGKITGTTSLAVPVQGGSVTLDFSKVTGYNSNTLAGPSFTQDGSPPGSFTNIDVENGGKIFAKYSNGQSKLVGSVALANFNNVNGLREVGNNNWMLNSDAGAQLNGVAGTQGLGNLHSGVLESSNVNLSGEFVDMISAQRDFQSNAKVIKTAKVLDETLINT